MTESPNTKNWLKCALAVKAVRTGILSFVTREIDVFHKDILKKVPNGELCNSCTIQQIVPCPTRNVCGSQFGKNKCPFHKTIPSAICHKNVCDKFRIAIEEEHRYRSPTWKNTDASKWCTNSWQLAKCFMPKDGYEDICSADQTDFNGFMNVLLNCKRFEALFDSDLSSKTGVCHKVICICVLFFTRSVPDRKCTNS